ncbi:hypothetical protein Tco_0273638 [Tanacetum coccineum]|uniref:Uncharacterized protein n=1 Tax=Tanacetum coccineum TaxID=301880 RepID=A0ABQ5J6Q5_9ASTR
MNIYLVTDPMLTISKAVIILSSISNTLVSIVSTRLGSTRKGPIVGPPGCLAAAAANLHTFTPRGWGVVSSNLFRGGVSASGISALRLVDGAGRGIGCSGSGMYHWYMILLAPHGIRYHTLENVVPAPNQLSGAPVRDPQMDIKIVPRSEKKYSNCGIS